MQTKDHKMLAQLLLETAGIALPHLYQKAFILGNMEPDMNPFTYLHGMTYGQKFHGHSYDNILPIMRRLFHRLQRKKYMGFYEYYQLGKLSHYVADSFTFPHNSIFHGTLLEHREYEKELHQCVEKSFCRIHTPIFQKFFYSDFDAIERLHDGYLQAAGSTSTDCCYILQAAEYVFGMLQVKASSPQAVWNGF